MFTEKISAQQTVDKLGTLELILEFGQFPLEVCYVTV